MGCCQLVEHGADNAKVTGLIPVQAMHFRMGLMILVGPFQLKILRFSDTAESSANLGTDYWVLKLSEGNWYIYVRQCIFSQN